jgi:hypothetical protein
MDVDEKSMIYSLCQLGWPVFLLVGMVGIPIVSPLTASMDIPTKQTAKDFPIIEPMDAVSTQSRNQYNEKKCSWKLEKIKEDLAEKNSSEKVQELTNFVAKFTVHNSDLIFRQTAQAKTIEKPSPNLLCQESLRIALEQTLPLANEWECKEEFTKCLCENYGIFGDTLKKEFGDTDHLSQNQPDDGSGVVVAFDSEYAEDMERKTNLIVNSYNALFALEDCPEEIMAFLSEYVKNLNNDMANIKMSLGPSQTSAALNHIKDMLPRVIVSKANEIFEKFPYEKLKKIYKIIVAATLQVALPTISELGSLWALANTLKNTDTSPLRKNFERAFRTHGTSIINQDNLEEEQDIDQANQSEVEKRIAAKRKCEANQRKQDIAEKYTTVQIDTIIELLRTITRDYLNVFQKRYSRNWPI